MIKKDVVSARFPVGGVTRRTSLQSSSPYVCYESLNVFPDCVFLERERGGSRAPLITDWTIGAGQVNMMCELGYISGGEVVRELCVGGRNGTLNTIDTDGVITEIGSGLNTGPTLTADAMEGKLFIARGSDANESLMEYVPGAGLSIVAATAGTIPIKSKICIQWRDRIVLADGEDPHVIYMSRQGDPYDWDYLATDVQRAVDFSATPAGRIGRPVRALIPHSNNCLIIATDNEFYVLRGDPTAGGRVMLIQNVLGIMGRRAWCHSPDGYLWVMTHDGLYVMPPGCGDPLYSVSREKLPQELVNYDPTEYIVTMAYCPRMRGVLVFMTEDDTAGGTITPPYCGTVNQGSAPPQEASIQVTHFFVDIRNSQSSDSTNKYAASFWPMSMGRGSEPTYAISNHTVGNEPGSYFGTVNGKVSHFERTINSRAHPWPPTDVPAADSDGGAFHSFIMLGPFTTGQGGTVGVLEQIRGFLAYDSKPVEYEIYAGDDAESPLHYDPVFTGTFSLAGANHREHCRIRAKFFYVLLKDIEKEAWAFEDLHLTRQYRPGRDRIHYPQTKTFQLDHNAVDETLSGIGELIEILAYDADRDYPAGDTYVTWRVLAETNGVSTFKSEIYVNGGLAFSEEEDMDTEKRLYQYTEEIVAGLTEGDTVSLRVALVSGSPVTILNSETSAKLNIFEGS